jgi:hypothetical protein
MTNQGKEAQKAFERDFAVKQNERYFNACKEFANKCCAMYKSTTLSEKGGCPGCPLAGKGCGGTCGAFNMTINQLYDFITAETEEATK